MAASSSSSDTRKYDVFLSFRGEDTRKNFVCHLYRALEQKAIYTFIDSEELDKGNKILELLDAIEDSRLSIVVLSENYASSSWCLKELVKILECQYTNNQIVVPIFYHVDPSNIRKLKRKFGEAFAKHGENSTAQSWRSALTRVADLSGWDSTKYEDDGKLIEEIVEDTFKKLIYISSSKAIGLVGMDSHIKEMSLRLFRGVNDVRVVGIWGMGGIGKTTIARAVYDQIAWQFEHSCFLDNVKEAFINKREAQMQEELLSRLLKEKVQSVGLNRGRNMIMERLGKKEVLVVLDDVENSAQIEALLGNLYSFGVGSRIIITSRDKQSLSGVDELYEPNHLSRYEAHELFMKYAFGKNQPHRGLQSSLMACHKLCSREMVRQDPGGRSRLWSYEDVDRLLTPNTATEAVVDSMCQVICPMLTYNRANNSIYFLGQSQQGSVLWQYGFIFSGSVQLICDKQMKELVGDEDFEEANLPEKFVEEMAEKGLLVKWKPLAGSVVTQGSRVFFTHGGWNSTIKALSLGVAMVAM
ncbi:hypothetical protein M0R45_025551 [Rubus argutus]|uniref:TIR domain-containing protein n=1 Tax=Rubus argutus TaxID=59490 RepID=A0AAW1WUA9_RUBAR